MASKLALHGSCRQGPPPQGVEKSDDPGPQHDNDPTPETTHVTHDSPEACRPQSNASPIRPVPTPRRWAAPSAHLGERGFSQAPQ